MTRPPPSNARTSDAKRVRAYFASLPPAARKRLQAIRKIARAVAPDAVESISYGIPTLKLDGRPLIYYAAFKHHTSLYPMTAAIRRRFAAQLEDYEQSKGTVRFALDQPLPVQLIAQLARARLRELRQKTKAKSRP